VVLVGTKNADIQIDRSMSPIESSAKTEIIVPLKEVAEEASPEKWMPKHWIARWTNIGAKLRLMMMRISRITKKTRRKAWTSS